MIDQIIWSEIFDKDINIMDRYIGALLWNSKAVETPLVMTKNKDIKAKYSKLQDNHKKFAEIINSKMPWELDNKSSHQNFQKLITENPKTADK